MGEAAVSLSRKLESHFVFDFRNHAVADALHFFEVINRLVRAAGDDCLSALGADARELRKLFGSGRVQVHHGFFLGGVGHVFGLVHAVVGGRGRRSGGRIDFGRRGRSGGFVFVGHGARRGGLFGEGLEGRE